MDKVKVYPRIGRALLSVWVIVWILLICKFSIPYAGLSNLMSGIFSATLVNLAFNPCAFIGAILLDLVALKENPARKSAWRRLMVMYFILWIILCFYVFRNFSNRATIVRSQLVEKALSK